MAEAEQRMEGVTSKGDVTQRSDIDSTKQHMKDVEAGKDVLQEILSNPANLTLLAKQLAQVREIASQVAATPDEKLAIGAIDAAATSADSGDGEGVRKYLKMLAPVGKWISELASEAGASLLGDMLTSHLGLHN